MRTPAEILKRMKKVSEQSFLGFGVTDLLCAMPYADAKPHLKDEVTEAEFNAGATLTDDAVRAVMVAYLPFAWDKALGHRGLSAARSIEHICAWLWLLGDHELLELAEDDNEYPNYGAPILMAIAKKYNGYIPDGEKCVRMANGECCVDGCKEGCG